MSTFLLEIVTPERKVYAQEVNMVIVRGIQGELGIMPGHIPLVTPLQIGPLRVKNGSQESIIAVNGGFVEVRKDKVVVLAESAELPSDIDPERAQAAKQRAEQRLSGKGGDTDRKRAELSLQRAINRLEVKRGFGSHH